MSTNLELQLYSSIEINLKVGEACIFLFGGFGVVTLIWMKYLNLSSQNRGVGLESKIFWSRLWIHKMTKLSIYVSSEIRLSKAKNTIFALETLVKMHEFDRNLMENSKNISETKFSWKYLQFDTISSHFAQFDYKKQWNRVRPLMVLWRKKVIFLKN